MGQGGINNKLWQKAPASPGRAIQRALNSCHEQETADSSATEIQDELSLVVVSMLTLHVLLLGFTLASLQEEKKGAQI